MRSLIERAGTCGCSVLLSTFGPQEDIFYDPLHTDGGVYKSAHELLRPYLNTHTRSVVVLDQQFGGEVRQNKYGWQFCITSAPTVGLRTVAPS